MTGAILAGGKSRRMGFNKAFIKLNDETIIERSVKLLKKIFDDTIVVANEPLLYENLSVRIVTDIYKGAGSLGGIYTALFHSKGEYAFVTACDMPCLDEGAIRTMLSPADSFDAFIPCINGRYHPMHALYSRRCMRPIEEMIKSGNLKVGDLIDRIRVKALELKDFKGQPIEMSVENINTKDDLLRIKEARSSK